jgi:drug/metabolite transporter (DMT)-like permease
VVGNALWAGTYAAGKLALGSLSFVELNAIRFSIATLLLAPVFWSGRAILRRELTDSASRRAVARLVILGFVLNKAFEYAGLELSTAVDVALLIATESLFTAVLSWVTLGERITRAHVAALGLGTAGAYLVVARGLIPDLSGEVSVLRIVGDLLVIVALLCEAAYTVGGKTTLERVPPLLLVSLSVAGSLLVWLPAAALNMAYTGLPAMPFSTWLALIYMAAFATVAGYWAWFRSLTVLNASTAAPFLFIQPLLGAALGVVLLGETITWATIAGGGLIVASLLLISRAAAAPAPAPIPEPPWSTRSH